MNMNIMRGVHGGPLVTVKFVYEDGTEKTMSPEDFQSLTLKCCEEKLTTREATTKRILLQRKGWKVREGKFVMPSIFKTKRYFSTAEALKLQEIFGE